MDKKYVYGIDHSVSSATIVAVCDRDMGDIVRLVHIPDGVGFSQTKTIAQIASELPPLLMWIDTKSYLLDWLQEHKYPARNFNARRGGTGWARHNLRRAIHTGQITIDIQDDEMLAAAMAIYPSAG